MENRLAFLEHPGNAFESVPPLTLSHWKERNPEVVIHFPNCP